MELSRRALLKGMSAVGVFTMFPATLNSLVADPAHSFSSLDEIFKSSFIIDDLSDFEPKPSLPDAGFSVAKESGITIVGPTLGDVEPETAFPTTVGRFRKSFLATQIA